MPTDEKPSEPNPSPEAAKMVQEAVRAERERMAELLHATISQDLTGSYLMVCATAMQCRKLAPELGPKLDAIAERLQAAGEGLRRVMHSLQSDEQEGGNDF